MSRGRIVIDAGCLAVNEDAMHANVNFAPHQRSRILRPSCVKALRSDLRPSLSSLYPFHFATTRTQLWKAASAIRDAFSLARWLEAGEERMGRCGMRSASAEGGVSAGSARLHSFALGPPLSSSATISHRQAMGSKQAHHTRRVSSSSRVPPLRGCKSGACVPGRWAMVS